MVKRHKFRGFTVIEVSLVVAISLLLLASVLGGLSARIHDQRYRDAVTDIADYLRGVYSEVIYVENDRTGQLGLRSCTVADFLDNGNGFHTNDANANAHPGRSNCAVYGKLITFGEQDSYTVHTYDVIGRTADSFDANFNISDLEEKDLAELKAVFTGAVTVEKQTDCKFTPAGNSASHTPEWQSRLTYPNDKDVYKEKPYKGAVLIVRSPISNIVHTYVLKKDGEDQSDITIEIQNLLASSTIGTTPTGCNDTSVKMYAQSSAISSFLSNYISGSVAGYKLQKAELDFCVDSDDLFRSRRNIRFEEDGHDYTAVTLVPVDGEDNRCR